jgi:hypothetical protein
MPNQTIRLVLGGAPPDDVPAEEYAVAMGTYGFALDMCRKNGVDPTKVRITLELPSGERVSAGFRVVDEAPALRAVG